MRRRFFLLAVAAILILGLAACNFPLSGGSDESAVNTAVALNVALTQLAATQTAMVNEPSITQVPPTVELFTPTPSITLPPTLTPTLAGVWLTVLENTNCRSGPGSIYDWVTLINAGQMTEAVARNPNNDYYYVHNPNSAGGFCWLWSKYSSITGNITTLPVFTPQPTPTPKVTPTFTTPPADFSIEYLGVENCGLLYAFKFKIKNTGSVTWQSYKLVIVDTTTTNTFTQEKDTFYGVTGCSTGGAQSDLTTGEESTIANDTGNFNYNPAGIGHTYQVTLTVFSNDGRTGTSTSKSLTLTP